jgi:Zn-finger nucleic acid-binding protein
MRYSACPHCRGLWVSPETLASPHPPVFVLFKNLPGIEPPDPPESETRVCHDCGLTLVQREVNRTAIEICPKCGGVWLSAGTFDRVAEWYRAHPRAEWPRVSQLEAKPVLPGPARDRSGLPKGARAVVGRAFNESADPPEEGDPMKRALKMLNDLVDRGMTE